MIRFACPNCDKRLSVPVEKGGKTGICPGCTGRIQIPRMDPDEAAVDDGFEVVDDAPAPPKPASPIRRKEDVQVLRRPEPPMAEDAGDDDIPVAQAARRKKKKRRRKRSSSGNPLQIFGRIDPYLLGIGALILVSLLSLLPGLLFSPLLILPVGLGIIVSLVGRVWFLIIAFRDDSTQGMICFIFPLYSIAYLIANFEEEKWPFFVEVIGTALFVVAFCAGGMHG